MPIATPPRWSTRWSFDGDEMWNSDVLEHRERAHGSKGLGRKRKAVPVRERGGVRSFGVDTEVAIPTTVCEVPTELRVAATQVEERVAVRRRRQEGRQRRRQAIAISKAVLVGDVEWWPRPRLEHRGSTGVVVRRAKSHLERPNRFRRPEIRLPVPNRVRRAAPTAGETSVVGGEPAQASRAPHEVAVLYLRLLPIRS